MAAVTVILPSGYRLQGVQADVSGHPMHREQLAQHIGSLLLILWSKDFRGSISATNITTEQDCIDILGCTFDELEVYAADIGVRELAQDVGKALTDGRLTLLE